MRLLKSTGSLLALLGLAAGVLGFRQWRTGNIGSVQRGYDVAASHGCFACHGPGGLTGQPDAGPGIGSVPSFTADDVRSYAQDEGEIAEWILDGVPRRLREDATTTPTQLVRMPAWRGRLADREVADIVNYIKAVSDFPPAPPGDAALGREAAARRGCFACHGPQGRGNNGNAGSLKGYIPSWDGRDFPELAKDDKEIREWIQDGAPRRLRESRLASYFMERQVVKMPAYRDRLADEEVERIVAYIRWLRRPAGAPAGLPPRPGG
jgi:mono/diheme cytochrome c family protein